MREDTKGPFSGVLNPLNQAFDYEYDLAGQALQQLNANGTSTQVAYNQRGQLSGLAHLGPDGMSTLDQAVYGYDVTGRLLTGMDAGCHDATRQCDGRGGQQHCPHPGFSQCPAAAGNRRFHGDWMGSNRISTDRDGAFRILESTLNRRSNGCLGSKAWP